MKNLIKIIRHLIPTTWYRKISKRNRFYLMLGVIAFLLIAIPSFIYTISNSKKAEAAWFDGNWSYRQTINITSSTTFVDYQVSVTLDTATLITAGKMRSDCNDIRITDINGKALPYWIEKLASSTCNTATTKIWTKIPSIHVSGSTIYIYYGNPLAPNTQSGKKTFIYFDDFNNTSLDRSLWTIVDSSSEISQTGGRLIFTGGSSGSWNQTVYLNSAIGRSDTTMEFDYQWTSNNSSYDAFMFGWKDNEAGISYTNLVYGYYNVSSDACTTCAVSLYEDGTNRGGLTGNWIQNTNHKVRVRMRASAGAYYDQSSDGGINWTNSYTSTHSTESSLHPAWMLHSGTHNVDNFFVRKDSATPPTVDSPTNEEQSQGPTAYWKFDEGYGVIAQNTKWQLSGNTTNVLTNPSLETNQTTWNYQYVSQGSATRTTEKAAFGQYSLAITRTVAGSEANVYNSLSGLANSTVYYFSAWAWANTPNTACLWTYNAGVNMTAVCHSGSGQWERIGGTFTSSAAGVVQLRMVHNGSGLNTVYFDGAQVELGSAKTPYCDGSLTGPGSRTWNGTPHASASTCSYGSNAEISGASWQTEDQCISKKCLKFDGVASGAYVPASASINPDQLTVSTWVKLNAYTNNGNTDATVISNYAGLKGFIFYISAAGKVCFRPHDGAQSTTITSNGTVSLNTWTHIAATTDGTNVNIYINGKLDKTGTGTLVNSTTNPLAIGRASWANSSYVNGYIDEPKLYSFVQSADQIRTDFASRGSVKGVSSQVGANSNASSTLSHGLVGYWKMDEATWSGTLNEVIDSSGNGNHGQVQGATDGKAFASASAKFGNAGYFDGVDDYVSAPSNSSLKLGDNGTISVWFRPISVNSGTHNILGYGGVSYANGYLINQTGSGLYIYWKRASSQISINNYFTAGNWYHIVLTNNNGNLSLYGNGQLLGTGTSNGAITNDYTTEIGGSSYSSWKTNSNIDEVRIYNRGLSPTEVSLLYSYAPSPIGYWNFEEGFGNIVYDKAGTASGVINNGSWAGTGIHWGQGKYGKGGIFNGSNDYVNLANTGLVFGKKNFTIEQWIKPKPYKSGSVNAISGYYPHANINGTWWFFRYDSAGAEYIQFGIKDVNSHSCNYTKTFRDEWYHIAGVRDGDNVKLYVNGTLACTGTGAANDDISYWSNNFTPKIGSIVGGYSFEGSIDEVRIYDYARSSGQIVEDMNAGHPVGGSPVGSQVGYWKFDEGYGTTVNNAGNGGPILNGTLNGPTWNNNGKIGKALSFDGSSSYVSVPDNNSLDANSWSIGGWFNPTDTVLTGSDRQSLISKWQDSTGQKINYYLYINTSGKFAAVVSTSTCDTAGKTVTGTTTVQASKWYHVIATFNETTGDLKIYVNGILENTNSTGYSGACINTGNVKFGQYDFAWSAYRDEFKGTMDEIKIYNSALTTDQIKLDYNQGRSLVLGNSSDTSQLTGGSIASNSASAAYCVPGSSDSCSAPIGEWNFEEASGGSANDTSGNGKTGTWYGTGKHTAQGKIGKAGNFTGTASGKDYVSIGNMGSLSQGTISMWMKPFSINSGWQGVVQGQLTSGSYYYMFLYGDNKVSVFNNAYKSNLNLNNNQWYYVTMTWKSGESKLYINGAYDNGNSASYTVDLTDLALGEYYSPNNYYYKGLLDQVRIFNYARTASQVAWDYNNGKTVGHWKFDECQGTTANDSSGNGNHGTITIGATVPQTTAGTCSTPVDGTGAWYNGKTGKYNYSMSFDGVDDYINIGSKAMLNSLGDPAMSISAWVKTNINSGTQVIAGRGNEWRLEKVNNSYIFEHRNSSNNIVYPQVSNTSTDWVYLVGTYDKNVGYARLYVNGILVDSEAQTLGTRLTQTENQIGNNYAWHGDGTYNDYWFNGQIDDVRIYNYALTANQVKNIMNQGSAVRWGPSRGAPN